MLSTHPNRDQLELVHELNRLFLTHLQGRLREDLDCCGLPGVARAQLRGASTESLAVIAEFPRALFDLKIEERPQSVVRDPLRSRDEAAHHTLCLTVLHCAWTISRQSTYQARFLLGL